MTKTFKRFNLNDRSKAYRRNDRKAYRTHFKSTIHDDNKFDDFVMPNRKHYGKINYKMNDSNNLNNKQKIYPKDINGNNSFMTETKNKFYHNTRQTKLIIEFNELVKENEKFDDEEEEYHNSIWSTFDYYSDYEYYRYLCGCKKCF